MENRKIKQERFCMFGKIKCNDSKLNQTIIIKAIFMAAIDKLREIF